MENGGLASADRICPPAGMKPVKRHKRATSGNHRHYGKRKRIHMEHWKRGQHHLFARPQIVGCRQRCIPVTSRQEIDLIQLATLGLAGSARSIE